LLLSHVDCEVLSQAQAKLAKSCTPQLKNLPKHKVNHGFFKRCGQLEDQ
jgi:hypothetical protein